MSSFVGPPRLAADSPRPSSTGSAASTQSSGKWVLPRSDHICVGEELRIAVDIALKRFRLSEEEKEMEFPSSLTSKERAYIHGLCPALGLISKSKGKGQTRYLTIRKKEGVTASSHTASFTLARNSIQHISQLVQRFPLSNRERQDLLPRTSRGQYGDGLIKELSKTATGRLNNGVPQIPPGRLPSDLSTFGQTLPVFGFKDSIVKAINENKVVLISGETGSGKTTQVPQMILDDHHNEGKPCRVFCTQPRRISALSVADRVAAERGEKVGQTVGYQIRLESRVSPKTLLTFCTNGVLLRTLMGADAALSTVTHVIVDEIHERDRFSDFLLIVLRDVLPKYPNLRLILMSAALNVNLFANYFMACPIIHVPGKLYEVEEYFLEDVLKLTKFMDEIRMPSKRKTREVSRDQEMLNRWCSLTPDDLASQVKSHAEFQPEAPRPRPPPEEPPDDGNVTAAPEPWVMKEMDDLLQEIWLSGVEEAFAQVFNLMLNENVPVDYHHSETTATPLMLAAGRGFLSQVEQLLALGASVTEKASNGWTALDWATTLQQQEVVELLETHIASGGRKSVSDEELLEKKAQSLSQEDRDMLNSYQVVFDDDRVNLSLILSLLSHIHLNCKEGAVLIFLPGYEDIVTLRDAINDDKSMAESRYMLYLLHSSLQSSDQKKVFKMPPPGVRKIVLSTNIAETSVTIPDIVYVIDSGKVKEKSFDALTSVSTLACGWVSKASGLQRKGRAGRCQKGVCYHLFSRVRHDNLQEYQDPEILRYPLQELCLHTKRLAAVNCPIADFLAKAPEPPAFLITRNAVHLLKQMDALDTFEDLTEVGHHMTDLPVEPRLSKMVLYAVVLKCLDPVLTIACALAVKDPFTLPANPGMKRAAAESRGKLSAGTHSDHMVLLRAFQAWQRARTEGWERAFCAKNFLSGATMEMIVGVRTQLLGQLRASNFVRARGVGDIRDLNTNSENWAVVKAALVAGCYPNLCRVDRKKQQLTTMKQGKVRIHFSSTLNQASQAKKVLHQLPTDWLLFEEMTRASQLACLRTCTAVSPITVALFAGPAKLPPDFVREAEGAVHTGAGDGCHDNSSDSEDEDSGEGRKANLKLDEWLQFYTDPETANLVMQLRMKWHSVFSRRMKAPAKAWSAADENVIRGVISVLTNEEQALGLQQPAGIGQRPKPMSAESLMSSVGTSRGSPSASDMMEDYHTDSRLATPKSRPFKFAATPPKKKDFRDVAKGNRGCEERSDASSQRSSTASGNSSLRGSTASSPTSSPQPQSPAKGALGEGEDERAHYFILKAASHKLLDVSFHHAAWATHANNERRLNKALKDGKPVYLVFSVHGSGHFQGYARMLGGSSSDTVKEFAAPNLTAPFRVEWIKRGNLPFQQCHHLTNPWNDDKRIQISRDGQEVEGSVGRNLLKLIDKVPAYHPRHFGPRSGAEGRDDHPRMGDQGWGDKGYNKWYGGGGWSQGRYQGGYGYHYGPMYGMGQTMGQGMYGGQHQNGAPVMILQRGASGGPPGGGSSHLPSSSGATGYSHSAGYQSPRK